MSELVGAAILVALALGVFWGVGLAMKKREDRWESDDWRRGGPHVKVGNALLEVQSLIEPGAREMAQEQRRAKKQQDGEGDPPTAGDPDP